MKNYPIPNVPFVEAAHVGSPQKPTAIVLNLSSTTSERGSALGIASWHHQPSSPNKSYHYIVDEEEVYRCIPHRIASYGNHYRAISVLMCAQPHEVEPLWADASGSRVLHRTASLLADLMLFEGIKSRYLDEEAEKKWLKHRWRRRGGLMIKVPGAWPYKSFLGDIEAQLVIKTM